MLYYAQNIMVKNKYIHVKINVKNTEGTVAFLPSGLL